MKKRILIIDDEADLSYLLKLSLEAEGYYKVLEETDPMRALDSARWFMPDVIVLDMMMPFRSGKDVVQLIRAQADPVIANTPVVFLTGFDVGSADLSECRGSTFLPKGTPVEALIDCIERVIAQRGYQPAYSAKVRHTPKRKLASLQNSG